MGKWRPFGHSSSQQRGFYLETAVRIYQRIKAQGGSKDGVFSEGIHSLKAQKSFSPPFSCQKIHRGLTVAPHGDGFFLKESRIQKMIFGVGQMPST